MKAGMSERGVITLMPETSLEAYALKAWCDQAIIRANDIQLNEQMFVRGSMFLVCFDLARSEGAE